VSEGAGPNSPQRQYRQGKAVNTPTKGKKSRIGKEGLEGRPTIVPDSSSWGGGGGGGGGWPGFGFGPRDEWGGVPGRKKICGWTSAIMCSEGRKGRMEDHFQGWCKNTKKNCRLLISNG